MLSANTGLASAHTQADHWTPHMSYFAQSTDGGHWSMCFSFQVYFQLRSQTHTCCTKAAIRGVLHAFLRLQISGVHFLCSYWHTIYWHISNSYVHTDTALLQQRVLFFSRCLHDSTLATKLSVGISSWHTCESHSETLQHLCSERAIAICCLLPLRLAIK